MTKENYERMSLVITEFDGNEILTSSGEGGDTPGPGPGGNAPEFTPTGQWEMPAML